MLEDIIALLEIQEDLVKNCHNRWSDIKTLLPAKDASTIIKQSYMRWLETLAEKLLLK